jgi:hypothetical protein
LQTGYIFILINPMLLHKVRLEVLTANAATAAAAGPAMIASGVATLAIPD